MHKQLSQPAPRVMRLLLTAVVWIVVGISGMAQNNPYKINDSLYTLYQKAYNKRFTPECLDLSRILYDKAVEIGDKKAQCLALVIPLQHYRVTDSEANFENAVKALQEKAIQTGYNQYFYFAMTTKVNYLVNRKHFHEAYAYVEKMNAYARKNNNIYGLYTGVFAIGEIHMARYELHQAVENFRKAIEIGVKYLSDQDMSNAFRYMAQCYENMFDYEKMLNCALEGYSLAKAPSFKKRILRTICYATFCLDRRDVFYRYYEIYRQLNGGKVDPKSSEIEESEIAMQRMIIDGNYKEAREVMEANKNKKDFAYYRAKMQLFRYQCRYDSLANIQKDIYVHNVQKRDTVMTSPLAMIEANFINYGQEYENNQLAIAHQQALYEQQEAELLSTNLELANTQLTLNNSSLELSRLKMNADHVRLSMQRKQLEADRLRSKITESRFRNETSKVRQWSLTIFMAVLFIAIALYLFKRSHIMRRLKTTNSSLESTRAALEEAHDKAVADDIAKTALLHNMSEEVNKPLNEIARLAHLITDKQNDMSREQLVRMSQEIRANTNELLKYVGDAIDKAEKI